MIKVERKICKTPFQPPLLTQKLAPTLSAGLVLRLTEEFVRGVAMGMPKPTRKVTYISCTNRWGYSELKPRIKISGDWLTEKYGLRIGDTVKIKYNEKSIVIETENEGP